MTDTVLNLGMNDDVVQAMSRSTNNPRFAYDTYRRFLQMYGDVVLGVDKEKYESILLAARSRRGVQHDCDLQTADLQFIIYIHILIYIYIYIYIAYLNFPVTCIIFDCVHSCLFSGLFMPLGTATIVRTRYAK